jgi:ankyrin repeat protein
MYGTFQGAYVLMYRNNEDAFPGAAWDGKGGAAPLVAHQPVADLHERDEDGHTALMLAASEGRIEVVRELVGLPGIDLNVQDKNGCTALMWAVRRGRMEIKLLATLPGINLHAQNGYGLTALALANCLESSTAADFLASL